MGEAENLSNAAQALTTAAQQYASAASEMMGMTGSAVALGHDLSTTWKGQASDSFLNSLDKLSGDGLNLMTALDQASTVMNGLALAIRSQLDAISKAERLQQQAEGFEQLTPDALNQLNQAQGAANTAQSTLTYLANSAASSLESVNTVGVCSTGLGVFNLDITTPSKDGKTTIMVDGKPMLVIDDATGQILENYTNGGSGGGGGTNGGGGSGGGTNGPWWHEWWGKDASLWKRILLKLAIGYSVSGISNGANVMVQGKPWNWEAFLIQGGVLSAAYESSILMGFKGPVDKIYSALITAIYGSVAYGFNIGGNKPRPSPGPAPTPVPTPSQPTHSNSPSLTPSPSLSPHASAPPPIH